MKHLHALPATEPETDVCWRCHKEIPWGEPDQEPICDGCFQELVDDE